MTEKQESNLLTTVEILKNDLRLQIILLLNMYEELSLTQLTNLLPKSKPTITRHIRILIENDIVKISKEEQVRGDKFAKYYSLKENIWEKMPSISKESMEKLSEDDRLKVYKSFVELIKSGTIFFRNSIDMFYNFLEGINLSLGGEKKIEQLIQGKEFMFLISFFSESQYSRFIDLTKEYQQKVNDMLKEENEKNPKTQKPYFHFNIAIPLKRLFEGF